MVLGIQEARFSYSYSSRRRNSLGSSQNSHRHLLCLKAELLWHWGTRSQIFLLLEFMKTELTGQSSELSQTPCCCVETSYYYSLRRRISLSSPQNSHRHLFRLKAKLLWHWGARSQIFLLLKFMKTELTGQSSEHSQTPCCCVETQEAGSENLTHLSECRTLKLPIATKNQQSPEKL